LNRSYLKKRILVKVFVKYADSPKDLKKSGRFTTGNMKSEIIYKNRCASQL